MTVRPDLRLAQAVFIMLMSEQALVCCHNFDRLEPEDVLQQLGEPTQTRGKKQLATLIDGTIPVAHFDNGVVTFIGRQSNLTTKKAKQPKWSTHATKRSKERGICKREVNDALDQPRQKNGRHISQTGVVVCVSTTRGKGQIVTTVYNKK